MIQALLRLRLIHNGPNFCSNDAPKYSIPAVLVSSRNVPYYYYNNNNNNNNRSGEEDEEEEEEKKSRRQQKQRRLAGTSWARHLSTSPFWVRPSGLVPSPFSYYIGRRRSSFDDEKKKSEEEGKIKKEKS